MSHERLDVRGVPIDYMNLEALVERLAEAAQQKRFFQIATVNLDFMVHSRRDAEVHLILSRTEINIPDGAPIVWVGQDHGPSGGRSVCRAPTSYPTLPPAGRKEHLRMFFLGGEQNAAQKAAVRLRQDHPGLDVTVYEPPQGLAGRDGRCG